MEIYNYSRETFEFLGISTADESPREPGVFHIPAFATNIKPPSVSENQAAVFNKENWIIKDDYRNKSACKIDTNGFFISEYNFSIGESPSSTIILSDIPELNLYKPKWNGEKWIEGLSDLELDKIKKQQSSNVVMLTQLNELTVLCAQQDKMIKTLAQTVNNLNLKIEGAANNAQQ